MSGCYIISNMKWSEIVFNKFMKEFIIGKFYCFYKVVMIDENFDIFFLLVKFQFVLHRPMIRLLSHGGILDVVIVAYWLVLISMDVKITGQFEQIQNYVFHRIAVQVKVLKIRYRLKSKLHCISFVLKVLSSDSLLRAILSSKSLLSRFW